MKVSLVGFILASSFSQFISTIPKIPISNYIVDISAQLSIRSLLQPASIVSGGPMPKHLGLRQVRQPELIKFAFVL